jgi:myo-inositol-1(or 4)-monophosphatase
MTGTESLSPLLDLAVEAAGAAGEVLKKRENTRVDADLARDVKLSSDKESESVILAILRRSGLPVLSEEIGLVGDAGKNAGGKRWIVDPLDGSINYLRKLEDLTAVSIALFEQGRPLLGVVYRWKTGDLWSGIVGEGAWLNGGPARPSGVTAVTAAVLATGFPAGRDYTEESLSRFVRSVRRFKKTRALGAAALMAALVSSGHIDAYMEEDIRLWDIAGAAAVAQAAGAVCDLEMRAGGEYKCVFRVFATEALRTDFYG